MKGTVEEVTLKYCNQKIRNESYRANESPNTRESIAGFSEGITESIICANSRDDHIDTCQGDSGSGLVARFNEIFYVHGVTSSGFSCATRLPAFYTRVSSYIDWIEGIVWP